MPQRRSLPVHLLLRAAVHHRDVRHNFHQRGSCAHFPHCSLAKVWGGAFFPVSLRSRSRQLMRLSETGPLCFPSSARVESLSMKNKAGAAKIAGTLTSFAGVMLLTLYKGVSLTHQQAGEASSEDHSLGAAAASPSDRKSWTLGTLALLANCLCFSFWLLLQSRLTKKYPALYSSTAYMFLISSMQGGALTAAIQRRASVWLLTRPIEIVTVLYTVSCSRPYCHFLFLFLFWF